MHALSPQVAIWAWRAMMAYIAFTPIYLAVLLMHTLIPDFEFFSALYSVTRFWIYPAYYTLYALLNVLSIAPIIFVLMLPFAPLVIGIQYSVRLWNWLQRQ